MPDQHAEVHVRAVFAQHRHVFGEGPEPPVDVGAQRVEIPNPIRRGRRSGSSWPQKCRDTLIILFRLR
jgi:hypothetical protein